MLLGSTFVALVQDSTSPFFLQVGHIFGPLTPYSCLTTYLSTSHDMGTQIIGERGGGRPDSLLLDKGIVYSLVLIIPALCQGAFVEEDESP